MQRKWTRFSWLSHRLVGMHLAIHRVSTVVRKLLSNHV